MKTENLIPQLFADCTLVKGAKGALLCDLSRQRYMTVNLVAYDLFVNHKGKSLKSLRALFTAELVDAYIDFFVKNEFAFLTSEPTSFAPLTMQWNSPSLFTNAAIAIDKNSNHKFELIVQKLEEVRCKDVLFRAYDAVSAADVEHIMDLFQGRRFTSVQWQIPYSESLTETKLIAWCKKYPRISSIVLYNAPTENVLQHDAMGSIYTVKKSMGRGEVEQVKPDMFILNQQLFSEALAYNTFYNRKLSINERGMLKNGFRTSMEFGHIEDAELTELANDSEFQGLWHINKDKIERCKNCEFRYACVDETIPIKVGDKYKLEQACAYNPSTQKWRP